MTDTAPSDTLALIRDLAAGLGLPVARGPDAADIAPILQAMEAASPGATTRLRAALGERLQRQGAVAVAAGAVQ
jgi:hypothetical protein